MDQGKILCDLIVAEVRRRLFDESLSRIHLCLEKLTEEEVWVRPNEQSNSVGNLILHLNGNARQWIVAGLGGFPDRRERNMEFQERGPIAKAELLARTEGLRQDIEKVLSGLTPEDLTRIYLVQGFRESGLSILVHVVEHFSYHVGQIAYFVKARKGFDLGFYRGVKLD